jgi:outer membrane receptor protein involved in Fe transport
VISRTRRAHLALLLAGSSVGVLACGVCRAADPPATPPGPASSQTAQPSKAPASQVTEIIVTADRSGAENIQNVPMSITAVNTDRLDKAGVTDFLGLEQFTPSLNVTQGAPGYNKFDMQGLTTGPYLASDTSDRSLVAVYLDDTPISVQGQTPDLRVFDLERVEVLAGPQGTLYGAGSEAGTVRYITAKPNSESYFGTIEATAAGTQHGAISDSFRGSVNIPLIEDKLAVRATVYQAEDGGFINDIGDFNKNNVNLDRTTQARLAVRYTPTSKLTIDFSYTYEKSRAYGLNTGLSGLAPYTTSTNGPQGDRDDFNLYNVAFNYDLGFADLVSSSSYTWRRIGFQASPEPQIGYFFQNYGAGPTYPNAYPLFNQPASYNQAVTDQIPREQFDITQKIHDYMEEVRLVSKPGGAFRWTVGGFFEDQRRNLYQDIPTPGFDTLSYENAFYGPFNTPNGLYNSQTVDGAFNPNDIFSGLQNIEEHQFALFTDDTWHATRRLDLTAGLRFFAFHENYYLFESGVYGVINHTPQTQNSSLTSTGVNPRFNIAYHINDDVMVYAEAAKGFRYGGANQPVPIGTTGIAAECAANLASYGYSSAPATFGPDHLWDYSIGEKATLADGRLTINSSAYYIDWSDVQTRLGLNCSYFFTENQGTVHSEGADLDSTVRLTREFSINARVAYNDARAAENIPTVGAFAGDLTPYYPRWIVGVTFLYDRPLFDGMLHAQANYQFRGDEQTTFNPLSTTVASGSLVATGANPLFAVIPSSVNVSASAAYDIGRYEFGIFGTNLTDGVKVTDIGPATYYQIYQAGADVTYARPRTIGARIKVKF